MTQKLQFKKHRSIVEQFGIPLSFARKVTLKQTLLLQKCAQFARKRKKLSHFGQKLQSKRLFSFLYGNLPRKQFYLLLQQASRLQGSLSSNFISLLEKRVDVVMFRIFHFCSFPAVRQYIRHHGIYVNNYHVTVSHYQLCPGDIISLTKLDSSPDTIKNKVITTNSRILKAQIPGKLSFPDESSKELQKFTSTKTSLRKSQTLVNRDVRKFPMRFPHVEVNYKLCVAIFLYSPKQVYYPIKITKEDIIPKERRS